MGKIAFLFSGQGDQYPGMGKELYEVNQSAKHVFDVAESIRSGTIQQCFEGTSEELMQTENTQPCLFCVDLAAAEALKEEGILPDVAGGFSLGEIAAFTFSGAVSLKDGFKIVCRRSQLMKEAAGKTSSVMAAVLKLENSIVEELCSHYTQVYPVNYNCAGQLVVSGAKDQIELFKMEAKDKGATVLMLPLSGGFHSPFMSSAAEAFKKELMDFQIAQPQITLYSNYTSKPYHVAIDDSGMAYDAVTLLSKQIENPVRWHQIIENMIAEGVDTFIEVGAGRTLSKIVMRIWPEATIYHVENKESLEQTIKAVKEDV